VAAVRRVRQHFKERGTLEPQTHRCGRKTLLTEARQNPLGTTAGPAAGRHVGGAGGTVQPPHLHHGLVAEPAGWRCKKNAARRGAVAPDVAEQRKQWPQRLAGVPATQLVFVDESGANTQMTRRYGRSPIGQRLVCSVPLWALPDDHADCRRELAGAAGSVAL